MDREEVGEAHLAKIKLGEIIDAANEISHVLIQNNVDNTFLNNLAIVAFAYLQLKQVGLDGEGLSNLFSTLDKLYEMNLMETRQEYMKRVAN